jgi:hypothetical protein
MKLAIDLDGLDREEDLERIVHRIREAANIPDSVACHWEESPARPHEENKRYIWLIFEAKLPCNAYKSVVTRVKRITGIECIDGGCSAKRTILSDKIDENTGRFSNRQKVYGGCFPNDKSRRTSQGQIEACMCLVDPQDTTLPDVPLQEGDLQEAVQTVSAPDDIKTILQTEIRRAGGLENATIVGTPKVTKDGTVFVSTDVKDCPFKGAPHRSSTQYARFLPNGHQWEQRCRSPKHTERQLQILHNCSPETQQRLAQLGASAPDTYEELKRRVLSVFPDDTSFWNNAREIWQDGCYFGPKGWYEGDYKWGIHSLLRREKEGRPGELVPVSCHVVRVLNASDPTARGVQFCAQEAAMLLDVCQTAFNTAGLLDIQRWVVDFYSVKHGRPVATLHYSNEPKLVQHSAAQGSKKQKVDETVAAACERFYATFRLLPLDPIDTVHQVQAAWERIGAKVIVDDSPAGTRINLSLVTDPQVFQDPRQALVIIGPPGCGKTEEVYDKIIRATTNTGGQMWDSITSNKLLAVFLAQKLNCASYLQDTEDDDEGPQVRPAEDLIAEPRGLVWCINSTLKLADRPSSHIFVDESAAVLQNTIGGTMVKTGEKVFEAFAARLRRAQGLVMASADAIPEVEGRFITHSLGRQLTVLYKPRGYSASTAECVELTCDDEFWSLYVRILIHNGRCRRQDRRINVFVPCSTKAAVEKAKVLLERFWREGRDVAAFVHADSKNSVPKEFFEDPDKTWQNYSIVCINSALRVGVSFKALPFHFRIVLAYVHTGCGTSSDVMQLVQRVRPAPALFAYRFHNGGGLPKQRNVQQAAPKTNELLDDFAETQGIDRASMSFFGPPSLPPENMEYSHLYDTVTKLREADHWNMLDNVRTALRRRGMTIKLGGLPKDAPMSVSLGEGQDNTVVLQPLPAEDVDISVRGTAEEELIQRVLQAQDLAPDEIEAIRNSSKRDAAWRRYRIQQSYRKCPDVPLNFEEFVRADIEEHLIRKIQTAALALAPDPNAAAAMDEFEARRKRPRDCSDHLQVREACREMLRTLPGFADFEGSLKDFCLPRGVLEDRQDEILRTQVSIFKRLKREPSKSSDPVQQIVHNFNKVAKVISHPCLKPGPRETVKSKEKEEEEEEDVHKAFQVRKRKPPKTKKRPRFWKFSTDDQFAQTVRTYAGVPDPFRDEREQEEDVVEVANPVIYDQYVFQDDGADGRQFQLVQHSTSLRMLRLPWKKSYKSLKSLEHALRASIEAQADDFSRLTGRYSIMTVWSVLSFPRASSRP